jgi:hypothetical protein
LVKKDGKFVELRENGEKLSKVVTNCEKVVSNRTKIVKNYKWLKPVQSSRKLVRKWSKLIENYLKVVKKWLTLIKNSRKVVEN